MEIHPLSCQDCENQRWLWYCKAGNTISNFGQNSCSDQVLRSVDGLAAADAAVSNGIGLEE